MKVSAAGAIAFLLWNEIKNHARNIELGEFVVMPNHLHGILVLNRKNNLDGANMGISSTVGTTHALSLQGTNDNGQNAEVLPRFQKPTPGQLRFQNQGKNTISSIVGSYKSAVSKYCHRLEIPFA